jgi:hypothetical protein
VAHELQVVDARREAGGTKGLKQIGGIVLLERERDIDVALKRGTPRIGIA